MLPPPEGVWGMPPEMLKTLPGYDPDVQKNRDEARKIMEKLGYGPDKRLDIKVSTRNIPQYRDPAVILIDQLKEIYIDGELEPIDTANWYPKVIRKDFTVGLNLDRATASTIPTRHFYENLRLRRRSAITPATATRELEKLFDRQSMEADRRSASSWSGRSSGSWQRTAPGRSSSTTARQPAGIPCEGADDHGQQHLQRLALGRCLARQIDAGRLRHSKIMVRCESGC